MRQRRARSIEHTAALGGSATIGNVSAFGIAANCDVLFLNYSAGNASHRQHRQPVRMSDITGSVPRERRRRIHQRHVVHTRSSIGRRRWAGRAQRRPSGGAPPIRRRLIGCASAAGGCLRDIRSRRHAAQHSESANTTAPPTGGNTCTTPAPAPELGVCEWRRLGATRTSARVGDATADDATNHASDDTAGAPNWRSRDRLSHARPLSRRLHGCAWAEDGCRRTIRWPVSAIDSDDAPPPTTPPPANTCTTPDPFTGIPGLIGVCVNGGWVPIGHPLAGGGG